MPSSGVGAGGGAPFSKRLPFGSGKRNAGRPALRQNSSGSMPRFLNAESTNGCRICGGIRLTSITLKYGPEASASASEVMNLPAIVRVSARSCLRSTSRSLTVRNCSSTWLRFGLSLIRPSTSRDTVDTRSSSMLTAWPRSLTAASRVCAFTNSWLTCVLRSPSTVAILLAFASSFLTSSSRLPMVSENLATPSSAALRCGEV
ncbi:hypothetical protein BN970_00574 [Mycolicibacterium conceptionense]|uniref:Uncharacterized protein n=1 Tax=Mycolicibacterium conceptionense TaxID=451644 RepID=A0A0U1D0P7_9MYCO|nr:hypothetical protein BN970_00574 [Mycolicibacterium conceptionense]